MVDAVTAPWHGANYQARVFWENAINLLVPGSCVAEVTFEANGPKAFDDVVVRYDPAIARSGALKVPADYHQVKWHVEYGGRFGYADFIDPAFIGGKKHSLLERLRDAKASAPAGSNFTFLTTYRVRDDDPLRRLISGADKALLLPRLFDGTTDRSLMGRVRKLWRDHLKVDDDELRSVLDGFRLFEGHRSLDELRAEINVRAQAVGLLACHASDSDFRFDELARQLKVRKLNGLTKALLEEFCRSEGLLDPQQRQQTSQALPIAIRSFLGPASDIVGASPENTLLLTDEFTARYLQEGRDWQTDIAPKVRGFLLDAVARSGALRLILDAHASIAFLAGSVLDLKSGVDVDLVQKGRVGSRSWRADDGTAGNPFSVQVENVGRGADLAVFVNATHDLTRQGTAHLAAREEGISRTISFTPKGGPGPRSLAGGTHAADLADQITREVRATRSDDGVVHLFAACPNSLLFFLGQQHGGIAPVVIYEFDFDRRGDRGYHASFLIE